MQVSEIVNVLQLEVVAGSEGLTREVTGGFTGDLLSLVMAHAKEGDIWMTVQGHENALAVATLAGISAIVLTQGIKPNEVMGQRANELNIPILLTTLGSYEMCVAIEKLLRV